MPHRSFTPARTFSSRDRPFFAATITARQSPLCGRPAMRPWPRRELPDRTWDGRDRSMQDASALFESLHPLEIKVLTALGAHQAHAQSPLREEPLAQTTGLEPSQISMAIGWLLAKSLIRVEQESVHTSVSLTDVG